MLSKIIESPIPTISAKAKTNSFIQDIFIFSASFKRISETKKLAAKTRMETFPLSS